MIELEVYAAGVRNPDKMMGLALELEALAGLRYRVDTNHDIVYMEFNEDPPSLHDVRSIFKKLELDGKFVGALPSELRAKSKTRRLTA